MLATVLMWQTMLPPWVDEAAIAAIVRCCGITLPNAISALMSRTDPREIGTLRKLR